MKLVSVLVLAGLLHVSAQAQDRDPTVAPLEGVPGAAAMPGAPGAAPQGSSVIVRNGQPHLVVGTRLVAVGQKVGEARLERITETEIWLREGKQLTKVSRFAGIQRSPARAASLCKAKPASRAKVARKPASATSAPTPVVPCDGVTP